MEAGCASTPVPSLCALVARGPRAETQTLQGRHKPSSSRFSQRLGRSPCQHMLSIRATAAEAATRFSPSDATSSDTSVRGRTVHRPASAPGVPSRFLLKAISCGTWSRTRASCPSSATCARPTYPLFPPWCATSESTLPAIRQKHQALTKWVAGTKSDQSLASTAQGH